MSTGERIGAQAQARAIDRVARALAARLPGVRVEATRAGVALNGRGLSCDARLRWIAGLIR